MNVLPPETLSIIISFLNDKDKRILRAVSTKWFGLIKYNKFRLYLTRASDLPKIAERFSKYQWPIELEFNKHYQIPFETLKNYLTQITTLTGLNLRGFTNTIGKEEAVSLTALTNLISFDGQIRLDLLGNFTNLTSINLFETTFYAKLLERLPIYTKLESVSLFFNVYKQDDLFQYFSNPTRLTALYLKNYGLKNTENLTRFANLKVLGHETYEKLSLKFPALEELVSPRPDLLIGLETCSNLTALNLTDDSSDRSDFAAYSTCLRSMTKLKQLRIKYKHNTNIDESMKVLAILPNLEELTFYPAFGEHFYSNVYSNIISKKLTRLECLLNNDKEAHGVPTDSCIRQIGTISTLRDLNLRIEYNPSGFFVKAINYDPLFNLTNLTKLYVLMRGEEKVNNFQKISNLTKLRKLELSAPHHLEANLSTLTNLEKLIISTINQKTFDTMHSLTLLTRLQVWVNSKKINFNALNKLLLLRSLNVRPLSGLADWQSLTLLTELRELWISEFDTNNSIYQLTSLQKLTYLHCSQSKCSPTSLTALTSLQKLFLISKDYSDEVETQILAKLTNLRDWRLQHEGGFNLFLGPKD